MFTYAIKDHHNTLQQTSINQYIPKNNRRNSSFLGHDETFIDNPIADNSIQRKEKLNSNASTHSNGNTLPSDIRGQFEKSSGFSFADVQVHYNSPEPAKMEAYAYTQGNNIHISPSQEHCLEHELGHVVQQKKGLVKPTTKIDGVDINDDPLLEQEADNILNINSAENTERQSMLNSTVLTSSVIQRSAWLYEKPLDAITTIRAVPLVGGKVADSIESIARNKFGREPVHYHIFFDNSRNLPIVENSDNIGYTADPIDKMSSISRLTVTGSGNLFTDNISKYSRIRQISSTPAEDKCLERAIWDIGVNGKFSTYDLWNTNCQHWATLVEATSKTFCGSVPPKSVTMQP